MNACANYLIMYHKQSKILKLGISCLSTKHEDRHVCVRVCVNVKDGA